MVKVYYEYNGEKNWIDGALADVLDKGIKEVKKDDDFVILLVGGEGTGKSELRNIIGSYIQSRTKIIFGIPNIWFNIDDYMKFALNQPPLTVISHDEARRDLNTKRAMSKSNVKFTDYFSECRDNNQIHIVILPSFSDIDKYIALWRSKLIIEVGKWKNKKTGEYERGKFRVINNKNKKKLAYLHKVKYQKFPKSMIVFTGFFEKCKGFNYEAYKQKKHENKIAKYAEQEEKEKAITLTPRQIEVISQLSPDKILQRGSKDYEVLKKLIYSLRKSGLGESG